MAYEAIGYRYDKVHNEYDVVEVSQQDPSGRFYNYVNLENIALTDDQWHAHHVWASESGLDDSEWSKDKTIMSLIAREYAEQQNKKYIGEID